MFWASADNDGCHFGHHCCRRMSQHQLNVEIKTNTLISTLIYWILLNPLTAASKNECARLPATRAEWYHWIHAAGGASGSITMVVVFVGCLCCCGWTRDITRPSYVKNCTKITLRRGYVGLHFDPHWGAPHQYWTMQIGMLMPKVYTSSEPSFLKLLMSKPNPMYPWMESWLILTSEPIIVFVNLYYKRLNRRRCRRRCVCVCLP